LTAIAAPPSISLLTELVEACATHDPGPAQTEPRDWFNALLAQQSENRLPQEHAALARITEVGGQALLAARAGQTDQAWQHVRHARDLLATEALGPEAHRLAHTLICAQHAYLCYRVQDDAQAQALLEAAFQDDLVLEALPGYGFLRIHRIQLLHNLMRIHRARGHWPQALRLGHALLRYLEHPSPEIRSALPDPWNRHWPAAFHDTPPELVAAMHAQIAAELVALTRQTQDAQTQDAQTPGAQTQDAGSLAAALRALPNATPSSQVGRWASFQAAHLAGALEDTLAAAIPLLRHGPLPSRPLWQAAADDTLACLSAQLDLISQTEA
jgi:hypothetical protein